MPMSFAKWLQRTGIAFRSSTSYLKIEEIECKLIKKVSVFTASAIAIHQHTILSLEFLWAALLLLIPFLEFIWLTLCNFLYGHFYKFSSRFHWCSFLWVRNHFKLIWIWFKLDYDRLPVDTIESTNFGNLIITLSFPSFSLFQAL